MILGAVLLLAAVLAAASTAGAQGVPCGNSFDMTCCSSVLETWGSITRAECHNKCVNLGPCYVYTYNDNGAGSCKLFNNRCNDAGYGTESFFWMYGLSESNCPTSPGSCNGGGSAKCSDDPSPCDSNAYCDDSSGSPQCSCFNGYEGSGLPGDCVEQLQYGECANHRQCCDSPLARSTEGSERQCEISCDFDDNCRVIAYNVRTGDCYRYGRTCTNYKSASGWHLAAKEGSWACPSRSGCSRKVNLRISVTYRTVKRGQQVTLTCGATRTDNGGGANNIQIIFSVNGREVGRANTNWQGVANYRYRYPSWDSLGRRSVSCRHAGSNSYNSATGNGNLQVNR